MVSIELFLKLEMKYKLGHSSMVYYLYIKIQEYIVILILLKSYFNILMTFNKQKCRTHLTGEISKDRVSCTTLRTMPQLRHNPLSVLILRAFKSEDKFLLRSDVVNESGNITKQIILYNNKSIMVLIPAIIKFIYQIYTHVVI